MEKLVYLVHQSLDTPGPDLRASLIEKAVPALRQAGASRIGISVHDEHVAQGEGVVIRRADPPVRALVGFWMENSDDRGPCEDALAPAAAALHGYLVVESRPLVHTPPVGERAPGANLVTAIRKRADIDEAEFLERWNEEIGSEEEVAVKGLWRVGEDLVGSRHRRSLWYLERDERHRCGVCGEFHPEDLPEGAEYRAAIVASERITDEEWTRVPESSVFRVRPDLTLEFKSIDR